MRCQRMNKVQVLMLSATLFTQASASTGFATRSGQVSA